MQSESDLSNFKQHQESDNKKDELGLSRVDRVHGGEIVELIQPEQIQPDYNVGCQHPNKKLDNSGDFDEVTCNDCPMVWVFDKGTFVV